MKRFTTILFLLFSFSLLSQKIIPLWPEGVPNQNPSEEKEHIVSSDIVRINNVQTPTLEVFLPSKANHNGKAVVICPGGGYKILAYDWEGTDIAKWYNSKGIAAFVLKYRLPDSPSLVQPQWAPLQDAQRAMRIVRKNAAKWNINPSQIGIMGFSAGGHLASKLGTHFDEDTLKASNTHSLNKISARPDFMVLIYPVITFDKQYYHGGSKNALIGEDASQEMLDYFSNNLQVSSNTPPTFLIHSADDTVVPYQNSVLFYDALQKHKIPSELHLYPTGGHGYSLAIKKGRLQGWPEQLYEWIHTLE
jgi:acetyl esterase/lipase